MPRVSRKRHIAENSQPTVRIYKAAIYVRLSVEDARKKSSDSIGTQKTLLLDFLSSHPDIELYDIYEDVNYTGTNFNRPAFTRMIEDIKTGLVDCVIVKDLSRFGRSFEETGHFLERVFPFLQVRFISAGDNYDSLTASIDDSSLIVPLKNLMNEIYARDISKKVKAGKKMKQQRGEFCGAFAPYGYIKVGPSFAIDDETAPVVRQIFEWIIEGFSDSAIAGKLNDLKILPPSRYRFEKGITKSKKHEQTKFWYKSAIKRISEYPVYTGVMASGKYQSQFLTGGGVTTTSPEEWIITENAHPAIIDYDVYEAVKKIRQARKDNYQERSAIVSDNIFKGLIFCGDCGSHMTRQKRRAKHTFLCNVYQEVNRSACTAKPIREADLRVALFEYLSREIALAVNMEQIISDLQSQDNTLYQRGIIEKQIGVLQNKLSQNRRYRGSLREDYQDGILSEQDYAMMKSNYDEEKNRLQKELDAMLAEKLRQETTLSRENKWISTFRRFESEQQLSSMMISALVERIDIYDNARIEITLLYRYEFKAIQEYLESKELEVIAV